MLCNIMSNTFYAKNTNSVIFFNFILFLIEHTQVWLEMTNFRNTHLILSLLMIWKNSRYNKWNFIMAELFHVKHIQNFFSFFNAWKTLAHVLHRNGLKNNECWIMNGCILGQNLILFISRIQKKIYEVGELVLFHSYESRGIASSGKLVSLVKLFYFRIFLLPLHFLLMISIYLCFIQSYVQLCAFFWMGRE